MGDLLGCVSYLTALSWLCFWSTDYRAAGRLDFKCEVVVTIHSERWVLAAILEQENWQILCHSRTPTVALQGSSVKG